MTFLLNILLRLKPRQNFSEKRGTWETTVDNTALENKQNIKYLAETGLELLN